MADTNNERVGKTLALLAEGLAPFVDRECGLVYGLDWENVGGDDAAAIAHTLGGDLAPMLGHGEAVEAEDDRAVGRPEDDQLRRSAGRPKLVKVEQHRPVGRERKLVHWTI